MSFSVSFTVATKDEVRARAAEEMARVVEGQKVHARDQEAILQTLDLYLGLIQDAPEGKRFQVSFAGAFSWNTKPGEPYNNEPADEQICAVNGCVNIGII